jgi:hypothetical protein
MMMGMKMRWKGVERRCVDDDEDVGCGGVDG